MFAHLNPHSPDFGDICAFYSLSCTSSPCKLLFLKPGIYGLVQGTVGVGTVLIWDFGVAYTKGGGTLRIWASCITVPICRRGPTCSVCAGALAPTPTGKQGRLHRKGGGGFHVHAHRHSRMPITTHSLLTGLDRAFLHMMGHEDQKGCGRGLLRQTKLQPFLTESPSQCTCTRSRTHSQFRAFV